MNADRPEESNSSFLGMGFISIFEDNKTGKDIELIVPEEVARKYYKPKPLMGFNNATQKRQQPRDN